MQASVDHNVDAYVDITVDHREQEAKSFAEAIRQATPEIREKVIEILKSRGYLQ